MQNNRTIAAKNGLSRCLVVALPLAGILTVPSITLGQQAQIPHDASGVSADTINVPSEPTVTPFRLGDEQPRRASDSALAVRSLRSPNFFSSPTGTLLKSVAFPGWGQWSNGKKQKAAFYFGLESYWITKSLIWRHRAREAVSLSAFQHARDRRNYFYWLTGITVFISMFDAYADRYLLTLERTRNMPDDFWGEVSEPPDEWRLSLALKF